MSPGASVARPSRIAEVSSVRLLVEHVARRLAEAAPLVERAQVRVERAVRGALQVDVEAGLDDQAAFVDGLRAVAIFEIGPDGFEEVRRDRLHARRIAVGHDRPLLGGFGVRRP